MTTAELFTVISTFSGIVAFLLLLIAPILGDIFSALLIVLAWEGLLFCAVSFIAYRIARQHPNSPSSEEENN